MYLEEKMPVLSSLQPILSQARLWIFRSRLLLSFCLPLSVYFYLSFFFSVLCECDPFGVVATGITLVGPPGGPRTDSRRATRTPEGVRSCARADVLLSFDTLDDTPVMLRIDYTVYSFARERNRMTKKHRILSLYSNVAWILHFYFCFYYVLCNTLFQMYVLHVLHIFTNFKFTA